MDLGTVVTTLLVMVLVFLVAKIAPSLYERWQWSHLNSLFPHYPVHWLMGNLTQVTSIETYFQMHKHFAEKGDKAFLWWLGPLRCIVAVNHPDTVRDILRSSAPKASGIGGFDALEPWIGEGLLVANGKHWERNRRLLTPAFHFEILRDYISSYNSAMETFMDKVDSMSKGEKYIELSHLLKITTLDVILRCAFSFEDGAQENGEGHRYVNAIHRLGQLIIFRNMNPIWIYEFLFKRTKEGKEFFHLCDYVHSFTANVIRSRRQAMEEGKGDKKKHLDFLDILLSARDDEGKGLTDKEIQDEVATFTFAGTDTLAASLDWCMYTLGSFPRVQQLVYEDVKNAMGDRTEVLWKDLAKLKYVPLFLRETLRMYPTAPYITRQLASPMTIAGVQLPTRVKIDIDLYHLHNSPRVWDSPKEFRPERFEKEVFAGRDPYMFVPFSAGPRNCIGQNFAMNFLKTAVACLVNRFQIEADPTIDPDPIPEIVLLAKNGIHVKFLPRSVA